MAQFLVTSALPYANGPIHFGHVAGAYLPADVYVRYLRMTGNDVLYVCGTDEYGVAITLTAEQEGSDYREYLDRWHDEIKALFDRFGICFDIFSGTARCPHHTQTAQKFFSNLLKEGLVHDRVEEQWFSEKSGRFLPDRYLQGTCPDCGHEQARGDECPACGSWIDANRLGDPTSLIDGSKPILKETRHWYLNLPKIQKLGLDDWYTGKDPKRPHADWKSNVHGHVQAMLKDLQERPITRDLPWGVPLPDGITDEKGKVLYVWFDAPVGYISQTMEWAEKEGNPESWRDWWQNPDCKLVHFIGKDNIAFHMVVFPSMLLGQGDSWEGRKFNLPWSVPANEFYNLQGRKFSTSENWYLDNEKFFENYSADAARFYLLMTAPETSDSEFTWEGFQITNNSLLADKLGNFASRVLKFNAKRFESKVPAGDASCDGDPSLKEADRSWGAVGSHLGKNEYRKSAQALMAGCDSLNQFFDNHAPWKLAKSENQADMQKCATVLERCIAYLELLSRRLTPFCPDSAQKLRVMLGAVAETKDLRWGDEGENQPPATLSAGLSLGEPGVLFKKIDDQEVQEEIEALLKASKTGA
ncbi:MAG TPA: methionine--tRNA ligase [Planctomycetota bacterium]|nr:methionine--tRNA ligase [Planctomycetota bacterium]HJM38677.1 methionine--tRNA ligase [Planctomycetota bacterium]|tara:strand:- start:553 stop:2307 length:1755 start_codon:yes stop_codon:yes gene_type:complete